MQVINLSITKREEKDYKNFFKSLLKLSFVEWIKTYLFMMVFLMIFAIALVVFAGQPIIEALKSVHPVFYVIAFVCIYFYMAFMRSQNKQIHSLQEKYAKNTVNEIIENDFLLKKVKIEDTKIKFFYTKKGS